MAEYLSNPIQVVNPNQPVLLTTSISCPNGYVYHRPESGILILRGIVNNPCGNFALALDGEPILTSRAIVTPAAVDEYFNVTSTAIITIPRGCCFNLSVENVSESADPATTPATPINVQNANLTVTRIA